MTKEALKMAMQWMEKTSTFIPHKGIEGEDLDAEGLQVFNACKEALQSEASEQSQSVIQSVDGGKFMVGSK
jgi:hypothetical protein